MNNPENSNSYKNFFSNLEDKEKARLKELIHNTVLSKTSWKDDHLDRNKIQIVKYIFHLAENELFSYYRQYGTSDEKVCFLEENNCKTYDSTYVNEQEWRANNITIAREMNTFNKEQNKANVATYLSSDCSRLVLDIRVYNNKKQTQFTEEFLHFAYLIDQIENSDDPFLDYSDFEEIEEIDRIEYFDNHMADNFINDLIKHIDNFYPEITENVKSLLKDKKKNHENYLYFLFRDTVEHCQSTNDGYNCEFYEDLEGCYSQAFQISAQWYLHYFFGCEKYPVLPFYEKQVCVICENDI